MDKDLDPSDTTDLGDFSGASALRFAYMPGIGFSPATS